MVIEQGPAKTSHHSNRPALLAWLRRLLKMFVAGMATGVLMALLALLGDVYEWLSATSEFRQIQIGTPRHDVQNVLGRIGIKCGLHYEESATQCTFSDFWRNYLIEVDPATGRVVRKEFEFRRDDLVEHRLAALVRRFIK